MTPTTSTGPRAQPARVADHLTGAVVLALLILTAWGNAAAMLTVAACGLAVGLVIFWESVTVRTLLAVALAAAVAALTVLLWEPWAP